MKIKLYTQNHDLEFLGNIENNDEIFSAKAHAYMTEKQFGPKFDSPQKLINGYLNLDHNKLEALSFLIDYIKLNNIKNMISFGAGECVLEHILSGICSPPEFKIIATDFDEFFIEKAKEFFPNISPFKFDFFTDNLIDFCKDKMTNIDLGISFNSLYVMDDFQFIDFLKQCHALEIKKIIYFSSATLSLSAIIKHLIFQNNNIRKLFNKKLINHKNKGKFHGYARSKSQLKKIFKKGGYSILKNTSLHRSYKNVYILNKV